MTHKQNFPFTIFSSLTEENGHLLLDDVFWFSNLIRIDKRTTIYTSKKSIQQLYKLLPNYENRYFPFNDFIILKKINYRIHLLGRLLFCPPIRNSYIIFQGFDEITILFYLIRIRKWNNKVILILTNNVSPERLQRNYRILTFLLKNIFKNSDLILYHTRFELELIKSFVNDTSLHLKFSKIKYHLLGNSTDTKKYNKKNTNVISFFGPTMQSKPIEFIIYLITSDRNMKFNYHFYNVNRDDIDIIKKRTGNQKNVILKTGYMTYDEYIQSIQLSQFVFLPHNHLYEGKLSGIFSDCVSNLVPIISDMIEPIIEYFETYGAMGYIFDYAKDKNWTTKFLKKQSTVNYQKFKDSMQKCKDAHKEELIIKDFLISINKMTNRTIQIKQIIVSIQIFNFFE